MRRWVSVLLLVLGCGSSSSSTSADADPCSGPSTLTAGTLSVNPTAFVFDPVPVGGESAGRKFEVLNYECGVAPTIAHRIEGSDEFAIIGTTCGPPLPVNATCAVQVVFRPTSPGAKMARLVVSGDPRGSFIVVLQGTGAGGEGGVVDASAADGSAADASATFDEATLVVNPTELVFAGAVGKGDFGKVTITNAGRTSSGRITLAIDDSNEFVITGSTCRDPLPPLATCEVSLIFRPASVGMKTAHLTGSANPGKSFSVLLSGVGQPPPPVDLEPTTFDFGSVPLPGSPRVAMFMVSKVGVPQVGPIMASLRGGDAQDFRIVEDGCAPGIYATPWCMIRVQFQPATVGPRTATLVVVAAGLELTASLSGSGVEGPHIAISPSMATFGPGASRVDFAIKSTGFGGIGKPTIVLEGPDAGDFVLVVDSHCNVPLPTGVVCPVTVTFDPRSPGPKSATLRATASPGGISTAALSGN